MQVDAHDFALSSKCDLVVRSEIVIDRCAEEIWPVFVRMEAWMSDLRFENVRGNRGAEGEIRLVTPAPDSPYRSYYTKAVRVRPFEQYVVKVVPTRGADYLAFADFSFIESSGRTRIVYDIYLELSVPGLSEGEVSQLREQQHEAIFAEVSRNHRNLKSLVESQSHEAPGQQ